jgi:alpha-tubulin suppressor-like RCC1 family protein
LFACLRGFGLETPVPKLQDSLRGSYIQSIGIGSNDNLCYLTGQAQQTYHFEFESDTQPKEFEMVRGKRLKAVSVGSTHYGFVDASGRLLVCGSNNDYQLGTGNNLDMPIPVSISLPVALSQIACSAMHSIALAVDGTVWAWGSSMSGRCGTGSDGDIMKPTQLESISNIPMKFVCASQYNSGAIAREDGAVYAWGAGDGSQIGIGGFAPQLKPVRVPLTDPKTKQPFKAVSLAFGNKHAVAVGESGLALSWGNNEFGQLGLGSSDNPGAVDVDGNPLQHPPTPVALLSSHPLKACYAGENVSFFLTQSGQLYSCGSGETAQLGQGPGAEDQPFPTLISAIADTGAKITHVSVGNLNVAALTEDGKVFTFGWALGETPSILPFFAEKTISLVSCGLTDLVCST